MAKRQTSLADKTKERDDHTCQCCGIKGRPLDAHHILALVYGGKDSIDNMITLCKDCHRHVPEDPGLFDEYKESGGHVWNVLTGLMAHRLYELSPETTIAELIESKERLKTEWFGSNFDDHFETKYMIPEIDDEFLE